MKKTLFLILALFMLAACSKQSDNLAKRAVDETETAPKETYLSKVKRYKDGRTPAVDTVWTLHLYNQQMKDSYLRFDGYVYLETNTLTEVGVLWSK